MIGTVPEAARGFSLLPDTVTSRRAWRVCHATASRRGGGRNAGITRSAKSRRLCMVFSCP